MCGRYALTVDQREFEDIFGAIPPADFEPRYNIAPTQPAPVLRAAASGPSREALDLAWGFSPAEPGQRAPLINARSETAAEKRAFAESFRHRRCLVPADGYYEWRGAGSARQPVLFRPQERRAFAFAGLWQEEEGAGPGRFTILTAGASEIVAPVHDRMPVVLPVALYDPWLDRSLADPDLISDLLQQIPPPALSTTALSTYVNNVANEGPECWSEATEDPQTNLF